MLFPGFDCIMNFWHWIGKYKCGTQFNCVNMFVKHFVLFFLLLPVMLFSQVNLRRVVDQRLNDTIWTTGLQILFSSQTIGSKVTTQLRSAVSAGQSDTIISFGITMSRKKLVTADDESKAILKTNNGKRITLQIVSGTMTNFLEAPTGEESILHFKLHPGDIPLLKKEKITGVNIIVESGNYNYGLHEKAQEILNTQLSQVLNSTNAGVR